MGHELFVFRTVAFHSWNGAMIKKKILPFLLLFTFVVSGSPVHATVKVGALVLPDGGYGELAGKRISLITNQSAVIDEV